MACAAPAQPAFDRLRIDGPTGGDEAEEKGSAMDRTRRHLLQGFGLAALGAVSASRAKGAGSLNAEAPTAQIVRDTQPPLPHGARLAILGDSIMQQNGQGLGVAGDPRRGGAISRATGELTQVMALDPRVTVVNWYDPDQSQDGEQRHTDGSNQGVNRQSSTQIAARADDLVARNVQIAVLNMGTNNTRQRETVLADVMATVATLRDADIAVVVGTIRPNAPANEGENRTRADIQAINAALRDGVAKLGDARVILWDAYTQYDRGDGYADPLDFYDRLLHPNEAGAELGAWGLDPAVPSRHSLAAAIAKLVQPGNVYDDITAAGSDLLANPTLTGSVSSRHSPVSGVAPGGYQWSPSGLGLSTAVGSLEANPQTGGQCAVLTIAPAGTAGVERIDLRLENHTQDIADLAGRWVRLFAEVETDGCAWLMAPAVILSAVANGHRKETGIGFQPSFSPGARNFLSPLRPIARRRLLMSEPILCGPDITGLRPSVQVSFMPHGAHGEAVVKVRRLWMGLVPDPRPAFGRAK